MRLNKLLATGGAAIISALVIWSAVVPEKYTPQYLFAIELAQAEAQYQAELYREKGFAEVSHVCYSTSVTSRRYAKRGALGFETSCWWGTTPDGQYVVQVHVAWPGNRGMVSVHPMAYATVDQQEC